MNIVDIIIIIIMIIDIMDIIKDDSTFYFMNRDMFNNIKGNSLHIKT